MPRKNEMKCRHVDNANAKCTQDSQDALTANIAQPFFFQLTQLVRGHSGHSSLGFGSYSSSSLEFFQALTKSFR